MKKAICTNQAGFSLVETLVAITILLIVIVGPLTITSSSARSTSFASEQVQAFFLAQEGVEIVMRERDNRVLCNFSGDTTCDGVTGNDWGDFRTTLDYCFSNAGCGLWLETNSSAALGEIVDCSSSVEACKLHYNTDPTVNDRATYTYFSSPTTEETPFTRVIYMEDTVSNEQVRVRSVVTWRTGFLRDEQSVEVETYLFNIYGI